MDISLMDDFSNATEDTYFDHHLHHYYRDTGGPIYCDDLGSTDLEGIFVPDIIFNSKMGNNAAEHIAIELINAMCFEDGINIRFFEQLLQLHANKPYLFRGGALRKGWLENTDNVRVLHTGTMPIPVRSTVSVIPPISTYKVKRIMYGFASIIPYETVAREVFEKDINEFLIFQNVIAAVTGTNRLKGGAISALINHLLPNYLSESNMIWSRLQGAVKTNTTQITQDEINCRVQDIIQRNWWPAMMPQLYKQQGHLVRSMTNYTTPLESGIKLLLKVSNAKLTSTIQNVKELGDSLVTGTNYKDKITSHSEGLDDIHAILVTIEALKQHFLSFKPATRGTIACAQTHNVQPGDFMEIALV